MLFDIVIPVGSNDINQLKNQLEFTKKNIVGYRNIYIVSPFKDLLVDGCISIYEQIFPFTIEDVHSILGRSSRNGWYLQQLLKLYAGIVIPDILETYLVIDSDTYFLKPTEFLTIDGKCKYAPGTEYHMPYFDHMKRLHPTLKRSNPKISGIVHHMMFKTDYIKKLFSQVETLHNDVFWKIFLKNVINNLLSQ